jgi:putative ABC transport system permease protein
MKFKHTILSAIDAIAAHQSRSILTVLGIVIGVAAIIMVMALGGGARGLIIGEINQMGADTVVVFPGDTSDMRESIFSDSLTQKDIDALLIKSNVPNLVEIMPFVVVPGRVSYRGDSYSPGMLLGGSTDFFDQTFNLYPSEGDIFTDSDIQQKARVVVIGHNVKQELFGASDAVGESILIRDSRFRVVGVYPKIGMRGMFDVDELVIIPYTTAQTYLLGTTHFHRFIVKADDPENVDKLAYDIRSTLRETHGLHYGERDDFTVTTQQGLIDQVSVVIGILTAFLSAVVAISLLVGGIGIMNIMLVSVTERTKEIGLRKALGATKKAILRQFLWEAVVLTSIGGIIGILFGGIAAFLISLILSKTVASDWPFTFPISAAVLGVAFSATVGLIFGLYPAKKAAEKDPIEALRYE